LDSIQPYDLPQAGAPGQMQYDELGAAIFRRFSYFFLFFSFA
jgi:hypothetical protein